MPPVKTKDKGNNRKRPMGSPARAKGRKNRRTRSPAEAQSQCPEEVPVPEEPQGHPPADVSISTTDTPGESLVQMAGLPQQQTCSADSIAAHVPHKLKLKIWEGQFVNLSLLLKSATELDEWDSQGEVHFKNGRLCVVKRKQNSQLSIEKWTSANMIYTSIIFEHSEAKAQEMLKYMRDIRLAASRSYNWYKYDEQFRLRRVSNPTMSWGEIHSEFWLMYVSNQSNFNYTSQPQEYAHANLGQYSKNTTQHFPPKTTQTSAKYPLSCNIYNQGKFCTFFPRCRYSHTCSQCRGNHPRVNCARK
ncbi:uncharacterized protein LOC134266847 [Saccostrea cucullata]|uniref:uncharacterized protein LOC134266847 n=1 Tax=Saccostrea cuccullata TaxID=36930 RepID=UPI002ED554BD